MAVTVIATAKSATANSYGTLVEADAYFADRLNTTVWDAASDDDKSRALIMACRHIEEHAIWNETTAGYRTTTTQALSWPRAAALAREGLSYLDQDTIPAFLINAQAEQAQVELAGDVTVDPSSRGIKSVEAGSVAVIFDGLASTSRRVLADEILDMLSFWILNSIGGSGLRAVDMTRV